MEDGRVPVPWSSALEGAVAYLEVLILLCSYNPPDWSAFFSPVNWQMISSNDERFSPAAECRLEDGFCSYDIPYWALSDTDPRASGVMIGFPLSRMR